MSRDTFQIFSARTLQELEEEVAKELEGTDFVLGQDEQFKVAAKRAATVGERELAQYLYLAEEHRDNMICKIFGLQKH